MSERFRQNFGVEELLAMRDALYSHRSIMENRLVADCNMPNDMRQWYQHRSKVCTTLHNEINATLFPPTKL